MPKGKAGGADLYIRSKQIPLAIPAFSRRRRLSAAEGQGVFPSRPITHEGRRKPCRIIGVVVEDVVGTEEAISQHIRKAGLAGKVAIRIWLDKSRVI
ncbi:MAG: hypothetical protein AB1555_20035, partial [Nitrospirota bacterium]